MADWRVKVRGASGSSLKERLCLAMDELEHLRQHLALAAARMPHPDVRRVKATEADDVGARQDYLRAYA